MPSPAPTQVTEFDLQADRPGRLLFLGSKTADLFTKEISESFKGTLERNYVSRQDGKTPPGFVQASPPPQVWSGTMWTRDAGTYLRELVLWGYYQHACQLSECLMNFAGTDDEGYIAFPRYFSPGDVHVSGTEIDGQGAIIIGMVALWQRLPANEPFRARLYQFLHQKSSPVAYLHHELQNHPLIAGSGEFGGGGADGLFYNVVQNDMSALALLSAAAMEDQAGDQAEADLCRRDAETLFANMRKYLVDKDGSWIWCIDPKTLQPDAAVLQLPVNVGFGGLNGALCIPADVLGFDTASWPVQALVDRGKKTFDKLYSVPLRSQQFEKYGIWTQFDLFRDGLAGGPSYGQGYALQAMLLLDKSAMAGHALDYLAQATFDAPGLTFPNGRLSPYYFYERLNSPDAPADVVHDTGCGPLNLVNVAEPLKVARMIVGVDDTALDAVRIVPRLPPGWSGFRATDWPIRTSRGTVRVDLSCVRMKRGMVLSLLVVGSGRIPKLLIRAQEGGSFRWIQRSEVGRTVVPLSQSKIE